MPIQFYYQLYSCRYQVYIIRDCLVDENPAKIWSFIVLPAVNLITKNSGCEI